MVIYRREADSVNNVDFRIKITPPFVTLPDFVPKCYDAHNDIRTIDT